MKGGSPGLCRFPGLCRLAHMLTSDKYVNDPLSQDEFYTLHQWLDALRDMVDAEHLAAFTGRHVEIKTIYYAY